MPQPQDQFAAAIASEAVEILEDRLLFPGGFLPQPTWDEVRTGQRREGSYYAFASFFQKLATGLALWGMGQDLALTGYLTPALSGPLPVQPGAAIAAIRVFTGPIPAVLLFLAVLFAWKYPITRESHAVALILPSSKNFP